MTSRFWAVSTASLLVALGGGVALDSACSPSSDNDAGDGGPVCDPDSGDPSGCPCDPGTVKPAQCYSGPVGTSGKGICKTGTRTCTPEGKYTACEGEVLPQPETCNYTDDDCNGFIDDLPEIADAAVVARCNSPACDPSFSDAAITCWGPDPGICGAGVKTCTGTPTGGQPTGCNEFIHTPAQEICNGIDDDCNGAIDDNLNQEGACDMPPNSTWAPDANPFEGGQPFKIFGECVHGQLACVDYNCGEHGCEDAGDKCFPSQPGTEVQSFGNGCDGLDNDCNGVIDDHSCSDSFDISNNSIYCCYDQTFDYHTCATAADKSSYTSCILAN